jgi:hypothetical protein
VKVAPLHKVHADIPTRRINSLAVARLEREFAVRDIVANLFSI